MIHPSSFIHAVVFFKSGIIKFLAHEAKMTIPIANAIGIKNQNEEKKILSKNLKHLNNIKFKLADKKKFPLLKLTSLIPERDTYFETILITLNDLLVGKYLNGQINYISIQKNLLKLIKNPYFNKYYKLKPHNIYDIKKMIKITEIF